MFVTWLIGISWLKSSRKIKQSILVSLSFISIQTNPRQHPSSHWDQECESHLSIPGEVLIACMHTGDVEEERICIRNRRSQDKHQLYSSVNIWRNFLYLHMFWVTALVFVVGFQVKWSIFCHRFWNEQWMECWLLSENNNAQLRRST